MIQSTSSSSLLSVANDVAVELERYLRRALLDPNQDLQVLSVAGPNPAEYDPQKIESLRQSTVSRMEVWQSKCLATCVNHRYLVLDVSNQLEELIRLRVDFMICSRRFDIHKIDKALERFLPAQDSESRSLERINCPACPPSTPASYIPDTISVKPILPDSVISEECVRQISFSISDVDSVYGTEDSDLVGGNEDGISLLSMALLIVDALKGIAIDEKIMEEPICHALTHAVTEGAREMGQPLIENSSSSTSNEPSRYGASPSSPSSHGRTPSEIDAECLLRKRRVLELQLRLAIAELASACTDIKLFDLQNSAFAISPSEDSEDQLSWDHRVLELLQVANSSL